MNTAIKTTLVVVGFACAVLTSCQKDESESINAKPAKRSEPGINVSVQSDDNPKRIKGKIRSALTSEPIEGADVYLYDEYGALIISGKTSDENGDWEMDSIFIGDYDLIVIASGYNDKELEINVPLEGEFYDLGNIYMCE
jgi:hypothetical protein